MLGSFFCMKEYNFSGKLCDFFWDGRGENVANGPEKKEEKFLK